MENVALQNRSHHIKNFWPIQNDPVAVHENGLIQRLNYKGKLSGRELRKIIENYPIYKEAANDADIPWQMLAAIHYRESSLSTKSRAHGGPFQFDPPLYQGEEDFTIGARLAARFLQNKSSYRLNPNTENINIIKDTFWGYNGRAYGSSNNSPYVMNQFDNSHQNMRIRGTVIDQRGQRFRVNSIDKRLGAFTFYCELKKAFG